MMRMLTFENKNWSINVSVRNWPAYPGEHVKAEIRHKPSWKKEWVVWAHEGEPITFFSNHHRDLPKYVIKQTKKLIKQLRKERGIPGE